MTCQEALRKLFADPQTSLTRDAVYDALDKAYPNKPWKRNTIYLHLIAFSINHPQRKHHKQTEGKCFLFWDGDKGFRKWMPEQDGTWTLGAEGIVRVGEDGTPAQVIVAVTSESEDSTVAGPVSLSIERDLEECLVQNLAMLEPGLSLYRDGDVDGRQLDTGAVGIIDLLALDKAGLRRHRTQGGEKLLIACAVRFWDTLRGYGRNCLGARKFGASLLRVNFLIVCAMPPMPWVHFH